MGIFIRQRGTKKQSDAMLPMNESEDATCHPTKCKDLFALHLLHIFSRRGTLNDENILCTPQPFNYPDGSWSRGQLMRVFSSGRNFGCSPILNGPNGLKTPFLSIHLGTHRNGRSLSSPSWQQATKPIWVRHYRGLEFFIISFIVRS